LPDGSPPPPPVSQIFCQHETSFMGLSQTLTWILCAAIPKLKLLNQ
jgi:hypothetical protein